jgi:hypothetical protein
MQTLQSAKVAAFVIEERIMEIVLAVVGVVIGVIGIIVQTN